MFIYIKEPPWHKWLDLLIWASVYLIGFSYGISQILFQPRTIVAETGQAFLTVSGGVASFGAIFCLIGVLRREIKWEAAGIWLVISGAIVYPITIWGIAFNADPYYIHIWNFAFDIGVLQSGRLPQALATTIAILLFLGRALRLSTASRTEIKLDNMREKTEAMIKDLSGG